MSIINIRPLRLQEYRKCHQEINKAKPFAYFADSCSHCWPTASVSPPRYLWAVEVDDRIAGIAGAARAETAPDLWQAGVFIWPDERRRGAGAAAYRHLIDTLRPRGARRLLAGVQADHCAGLRFAAQRGFEPIGSLVAMQLQVAAADVHIWGDADAFVAAQGLRFTTLDRFPRQGLAERLLPLWNRSRPDQPQDWPFAPYYAQRLEREMLEPAESALEHSFAVVGAANQVVALTLNAHVGGNHLLTTYLGVDPGARRRGLARALKLKLIAHAQAHGVEVLAAENDRRNTAMIAINRRLGYRPVQELVMHQAIVAL
jgi:L-amino acid N-acyltransferase YncA